MLTRKTSVSPVKRYVLLLAANLGLVALVGLAFVYWQVQKNDRIRERSTNYHLGSVHHVLAAERSLQEIDKLIALERASLKGAPEKPLSDALKPTLRDQTYLTRSHLVTIETLQVEYAEAAYEASSKRLMGLYSEFVEAIEMITAPGGGEPEALDALKARLDLLRTGMRQLHDLHVDGAEQSSKSLSEQQMTDLYTLAGGVLVLALLGVMVLSRGLRLIDEGRRRETETLEVNARLGRILEELWNEIYVFDADSYRFLQVNKGALSNMGCSMDEMRGLTAFDIKPEFTREIFAEAVQPLRDGHEKFLIFQARHQRKDGTCYPVEVRLQLLADEDPPVFAAIVNDITERRRAENEIRELNQDLERRVEARTAELSKANGELHGALGKLYLAQDQLVQTEKMASLGGLVAGVAHEINTPVGISVTAASHLHEKVGQLEAVYGEGKLRRSDMEAFMRTARESSEIVLSNLQRASRLIGSFKQVAIDQSSEERRRFGLAAYLEEIVTSLRPQLKTTRQQVTIACDPGFQVDSYPGVLSQVITNFVINALMHAYDEDTAGTMRIAVVDRGGTIALSFADDGRGIPKDHVAQIFDPFFTTRRGQGGSGLGLNIVYNLVTQKLGGTIVCHSTPGAGTRFEISFPAMMRKAA